MKMRKIFSVAAVSAAVVGMSLFGGGGTASAAAPASAFADDVNVPDPPLQDTNITFDPAISGPHYQMHTDDDNPGGRIDFWPNGDVVTLCDVQADGKDITALYFWGDVYHYREIKMSARGGNGTCTVSRVDIPEGDCVGFYVGLSPGPTFTDYAQWLNDNDIKTTCSMPQW
jgi:hypothetical protein